MARINLYGNTERAVQIAKYLHDNGHGLAIVTSTEQDGEPSYTDRLFQYQTTYYTDCDIILAVNWRRMIDDKTRATARYGAFCLHDSLLPKYRGHSPVVWAWEDGAEETGVTMFRMNETADGGPIIGQRRIPVLHSLRATWDALTPLYIDLVRAHLPAILDGTVVEYPQDPATIQPARPKKEWPK